MRVRTRAGAAQPQRAIAVLRPLSTAFSIMGLPPASSAIHGNPDLYIGEKWGKLDGLLSQLFDFIGVPNRIRTGVAAVKGL